MSREKKIFIAIMAASAAMMASLSLSPMLAGAVRAFPNADVALVQMLVTLPSLLAMVSTVVAGALDKVMTKKQILAWSLIIMFGGGAATIFLHNNLMALLIASGASGIGFGGLQTMTAALIPDYFSGKRRSAVMGYQSTSVTLGSALLVLLSGALASVKWYYAYYSFILLVPTIALVQLFLPNDKTREGTGSVEKMPLRPQVYLYVAYNLVFSLLITAYNTNISLLVEELQLGGSTVAGIINAVFNLFGAGIGLVAGRMIQRCAKLTLGLSALLGCLGLLLCGFGVNLAMLMAGSVLAGCSFTLRAAAGFEFSSQADPGNATMAIALVCAGGAIGQFLTTVTVNPVAALFSNTAGSNLAVAGVGLGLLAVISAALALVENRLRNSVAEKAN